MQSNDLHSSRRLVDLTKSPAHLDSQQTVADGLSEQSKRIVNPPKFVAIDRYWDFGRVGMSTTCRLAFCNTSSEITYLPAYRS